MFMNGKCDRKVQHSGPAQGFSNWNLGKGSLRNHLFSLLIPFMNNTVTECLTNLVMGFILSVRKQQKAKSSKSLGLYLKS